MLNRFVWTSSSVLGTSSIGRDRLHKAASTSPAVPREVSKLLAYLSTPSPSQSVDCRRSVSAAMACPRAPSTEDLPSVIGRSVWQRLMQGRGPGGGVI